MKKALFILLATFAIGCSRSSELSDSINISDNEYPDLPAYSEFGYNTFGANYDRSVFIYSSKITPLKVIQTDSTLTFLFQGANGTYSGDYISYSFIIPETNVKTYQDLLAYDDTVIDLANDSIVVEMISDGNNQVIDIIDGEIHFKRSQKVFVDDIEEQVILSGYFNFNYIVNNIPSKMTDGRFDLGVNETNFYNID